MAYNHGREDRKWRIWKEAEEKVLREHGVDEAVIEQIRMEDRADFNSNRRFYRWTSANTLREWRTLNSRQSRIPLLIYWTRLRMKLCIGHCLRWTGVPCKLSCCQSDKRGYLCKVRPSVEKAAEDFIIV